MLQDNPDMFFKQMKDLQMKFNADRCRVPSLGNGNRYQLENVEIANSESKQNQSLLIGRNLNPKQCINVHNKANNTVLEFNSRNVGNKISNVQRNHINVMYL